jgi:hypothetical protein
VKLAVSNTRALTLVEVVDLPAPAASRQKESGLPCAYCRAEVFHARVIRTTVPVCGDCQREADLRGRFICRDIRHEGDRIVGYRSIAKQWRDPLLDICGVCYRRRHPGRKATALDDNPHRDRNREDGSLGSFVEASRLVADWIRTG